MAGISSFTTGKSLITGLVIVAIAIGAKSEAVLESWKAWLGKNNAVVMSVLFAVIAAVLIGKSISGLTA